jgi:glycosyltransferase involved in cell wall biosynthesis
MRICFISREYPPDTGWGGIATFTKHLCHGLKDLGHEVVVVSLAKDRTGLINEDGIPVHRVKPHVIKGDLGAVSMCMPYSRYVFKTTAALWKKFFELHSQNPFDVVDTPELLAEGIYPAVSKAVPLVIRLYTPHSKFIAENIHNVSASFDHQLVAMMERVAMLGAEVLTSPSDDLADFVANDLNYPRQKIQIVRNPIDQTVFSPEGQRAIESDKKLVLFVGRLEERKGITYLVEAIPQIMAQYKDVRFVIIGDDTMNSHGEQKSVLTELKQSLKANGCLDAVQFVPRIPLTELPNYYRSADICVVPSVYDNSPYTCLEAMSCGRAVIGTAAGGTREYIVNGESGLIIPPRNTQAIVESILALLQNDGERHRLAANARTRVLAKFQRTEIARQTTELYKQAQELFAAKQNFAGHGLYLKPTSELLSHAETYLYSYDKMLYDLLYRESFRFRIRHWWRLGTKRPRLLMAKVFVRFANAFLQLTGRKNSPHPEFIKRLQEEIVNRQEPLEEESLETAGARK